MQFLFFDPKKSRFQEVQNNHTRVGISQEFKLLLPRKLVELTRFAASQRAEPLRQQATRDGFHSRRVAFFYGFWCKFCQSKLENLIPLEPKPAACFELQPGRVTITYYNIYIDNNNNNSF